MKLKAVSYFCFFCFFLSATAPTYGNSNHVRFRRITINDGLSLSSVYCIRQDSMGFMWFATEDGLNKYDGKNFTIYRPEQQNPNSLTYKWIEQIFVAPDGILWFGSRGGLTRFDPRTETFTRFKHQPGNEFSLTSDTITTLFHDGGKYLYVGTLGGLNRIRQDSLSVERIRMPVANRRVRINTLLPENNNTLWIGTDAGLFKCDPAKGVVTQPPGLFPQGIPVPVTALAIKDSDLWIGTTDGLVHYSSVTKRTRHYRIPNSDEEHSDGQVVENLLVDGDLALWLVSSFGLSKLDFATDRLQSKIRSFASTNSLSINTNKAILKDRTGHIWYGSHGDGLYRIDPLTGEQNHYVNSPADVESLSENFINCIYEDEAGVIWVGTFGAGISIYDPNAHQVELWRHDPLEENSLPSNFVWSILEARDGTLWIGTNDRGLARYWPQTGNFTFYEHQPGNASSLSESAVRAVFQDRKGNIWVGTDGGGLNKFRPATGTFQHFRSIPDDSTTLTGNTARVIYEDKDGYLWIGTREGLNRMDPTTGKCIRYRHESGNPRSLSHDIIFASILQDEKGYLWIGTYGGGLNRLDIQKGEFTHYRSNPNDPESLSDDNVFSIFEEKEGVMWIATNDGFNRFNTHTGKFQRFSTQDGLPSNVVYGILPDEEGNLWLSTNGGICRFNLKDYSTKNYDVNDGLQSNEFNAGAYHRGRNGKLYFGGVYGLNIIEPDKLKPVANDAEVVITSMDVLGSEVQVKPDRDIKEEEKGIYQVTEEEGKFTLPVSISYAKAIKLNYRHRFLALEFAALKCPVGATNRFAYRMENLDMDWTHAGTRNYISFANMDAGTYVLNVKAQNSDGQWSPHQARLSIIITPPFYRTWWFMSFEFLFALGISLLIYHYVIKAKTNRILKRQNRQIAEANRRLTESEHNLLELNATKDKFFSIIAHDLKNPFTSLLSITDLLLEDFEHADEEDKHLGMKRVNDAIKEIYSLLENLLTWSRAQTGRINFEPRPFNLSNVVYENINLHRVPAERKGIHLQTELEENVMAFGDRDMINTVVRNLLSNAVKFTGEGKKIAVQVRKNSHDVEVRVKDEGLGIAKENLNMLFRIDMKFKSKGTHGERGTGLGLILCKEFIERHGGKIGVKSKVDKGSTFYFTIPVTPEIVS